MQAWTDGDSENETERRQHLAGFRAPSLPVPVSSYCEEIKKTDYLDLAELNPSSCLLHRATRGPLTPPGGPRRYGSTGAHEAAAESAAVADAAAAATDAAAAAAMAAAVAAAAAAGDIRRVPRRGETVFQGSFGFFCVFPPHESAPPAATIFQSIFFFNNTQKELISNEQMKRRPHRRGAPSRYLLRGPPGTTTRPVVAAAEAAAAAVQGASRRL
ncbi:hypothetical protein Efla_001484 [Eimeria flavescens]